MKSICYLCGSNCVNIKASFKMKWRWIYSMSSVRGIRDVRWRARVIIPRWYKELSFPPQKVFMTSTELFVVYLRYIQVCRYIQVTSCLSLTFDLHIAYKQRLIFVFVLHVCTAPSTAEPSSHGQVHQPNNCRQQRYTPRPEISLRLITLLVYRSDLEKHLDKIKQTAFIN